MKLELPLGPVMLDIEGTSLTDAERETLRHPRVGGVILFSRNFTSREQIEALTAEIHALRTPALLVAVDHEGGRVQRFRQGFTRLPPMRALGELWMRDALEATRMATATGFVLAADLREVGVDLSFAPVLDLDHGPSGVIGDRSFHRDARVVAMLAKSVMHGMALAGMRNCGKHFPGHGYAHGDSHHEVPIDERDLDTILADDAAPYGWLGSPALSSVMPAHVVYPAVDAQPAGFSAKWLREILRGRMRFDGVIFSDDLRMEGASVAGSIEDRARAALDAGCDMVLVCNHPADARRVLEAADLRVDADSTRRIAAMVPGTERPDQAVLATAREDVARLARDAGPIRGIDPTAPEHRARAA